MTLVVGNGGDDEIFPLFLLSMLDFKIFFDCWYLGA